MFTDRKDAGKKLAKALQQYKNQDVIVFAIPKGGVEVAYEVVKYLNAQLSLLISRKLPLPSNPEAGFGAIAEDGNIFIFNDTYSWLSEEIIEKIITEQQKEIERRIKVLRDGNPLPNIENKMVILVDDGLAMGSTMRVAIKLCRNKGARKIIVAVPVAGGKVAEEIERLADGIIVLEKPEFFQAVAQVYINWHDVKDSEVINILKKWKNDHSI
jgi:predicted phosphoribosyltransferase